eukprot:m.37738 g.37738  ORF g.37738 m.37738 type:complete len:582 (-) comp10150_c0_seq1:67-1812(-)
MSLEDAINVGVFTQYDDDEEDDMHFEDDVELGNEDLKEIFPDTISKYLSKFASAITKEDTDDIKACYSQYWRRYSNMYYKDKPWPEPHYVYRLTNNNIFVKLYTELYFRHLHERMASQLTLTQRSESYDNFVELIDYIVEAEEPVPLSLPYQWLWDIIDEFIYQFLEFNKFKVQNRGKLSDEDQAFVEEDEETTWNILVIINSLQAFVRVSKINEQLEAYHKGTVIEDPIAEVDLYRFLGYFSLVGLMRLHTITGDYAQALDTVANIEANSAFSSHIPPACYVSLYHFVGFCYLMMGRYQDAVQKFNTILDYLLKTESQLKTPTGFNTIRKQKEQMFSLLALAHTLSPQQLEDQVSKEMMKKDGELIRKARAGKLDAVQEMFTRGLPNFLDPSVCFEGFGEEERTKFSDPKLEQMKVFMDTIKLQSKLYHVRSFLELYKTLKVAKLAALLGMKEEEVVSLLHFFKRKGNQLVWESGSPRSGERKSAESLDFYIDDDTIHIASLTVSKTFAERFVKESQRVIKTMESTASNKFSGNQRHNNNRRHNNNNGNNNNRRNNYNNNNNQGRTGRKKIYYKNKGGDQ